MNKQEKTFDVCGFRCASNAVSRSADAFLSRPEADSSSPWEELPASGGVRKASAERLTALHMQLVFPAIFGSRFTAQRFKFPTTFQIDKNLHNYHFYPLDKPASPLYD